MKHQTQLPQACMRTLAVTQGRQRGQVFERAVVACHGDVGDMFIITRAAGRSGPRGGCVGVVVVVVVVGWLVGWLDGWLAGLFACYGLSAFARSNVRWLGYSFVVVVVVVVVVSIAPCGACVVSSPCVSKMLLRRLTAVP